MTKQDTLTPAQRTLRARMGAHALHAQHDPHETTRAATYASTVLRFERQVDPNGELDPEERTRRAEQARKAYMAGLALASSKARAARNGRQGAGEELITSPS